MAAGTATGKEDVAEGEVGEQDEMGEEEQVAGAVVQVRPKHIYGEGLRYAHVCIFQHAFCYHVVTEHLLTRKYRNIHVLAYIHAFF